MATGISSVALGRADTHARTADPTVAARIEWRHVDLLTSPPELDSFDFVSTQFMQLPPEPRARLFTALPVSVRTGGALLVVGHYPSDVVSGVRRLPTARAFLHGGRHRRPARRVVDDRDAGVQTARSHLCRRG